MKLTTKSEYVLLALIYKAKNQTSGYIKIEDICKKYNLQKKYLEQLIYVVKQQHIVETKRGTNGGYKLAKDPKKISVAASMPYALEP